MSEINTEVHPHETRAQEDFSQSIVTSSEVHPSTTNIGIGQGILMSMGFGCLMLWASFVNGMAQWWIFAACALITLLVIFRNKPAVEPLFLVFKVLLIALAVIVMVGGGVCAMMIALH